MDNPVVPALLGNNELVTVEGDLPDKLKFGDPISGWSGDENMAIFYSKEDDRIYITSLDDHGNEYWVMRSQPGEKFAGMDVLNQLAQHDRNKGYDVGKDLAEHNAKVQEEQDKANKEKWDAVSEKLAWGLMKDAN